MAVPFIELDAVLDELGPEVGRALNRVLDSGRFVLGPEVAAFESEFASFCGARHCVGVGSGLDALQLIFRASGIGPGDEVVVPAYTAVATWMAVSVVGATPVGVDVDAGTYNIDPALVEAAITPRTRAIVAVHLFGQPADMDAIGAVAARHHLPVFEDVAQAHGARYRGRRAGSLAHAGAFSFYPTKNLGALGDGGAVTTDDDELANTIRLMRTYGWRARSNSEVKGLNSRLDELQAALLRIKLRRLDEWNERRSSLASRYSAALATTDGLTLPHVAEWAEPVWYLFVVGVEHRGALRDRLSERGVDTLIHYTPLPHLTPAYREDGWKEGSLPTAEGLAEQALSLPLYPQLSVAACDEVISSVQTLSGADG